MPRECLCKGLGWWLPMKPAPPVTRTLGEGSVTVNGRQSGKVRAGKDSVPIRTMKSHMSWNTDHRGICAMKEDR